MGRIANWLAQASLFAAEKLSHSPLLPSGRILQSQLDDAYNRGKREAREQAIAALTASGLKDSPDVLALQVMNTLQEERIDDNFSDVRLSAEKALLRTQKDWMQDAYKQFDRRLEQEFDRGHKVGYAKGYATAKQDMNSMLDEIIASRVRAGMEDEIASGRYQFTTTGGDAKKNAPARDSPVGSGRRFTT